MTNALRPLRHRALPSDSARLARYLIGKTVVRELRGERLSGRIVETEAYPPGDLAAHHVRGKTKANASLFARRGIAYVYFAYGSAWMLNVASESAEIGGGVLIRAIEPLEGVATMQRLRGTVSLRDLTRGPGRLAQALAIDRRFDGTDLCEPGALWLGGAVRRVGAIGVSVRIGISKDTHRPLRFFEIGNPFVSGSKTLNAQDAALGAGI